MAFKVSTPAVAVVLIIAVGLQLSAGQQLYNDDSGIDNVDDYYMNDDDEEEGDESPEVEPIDSLSYWDDEEPNVEPKSAEPCCLPKTWQGTLFSKIKSRGGRGKRGRVLFFKETVYVDEDNRRVAQDVTVPRRRRNSSTVSYILKFNNDTGAVLYAFSKVAKKCVTKQLKNAKFRPACLPKNSTMRASFTLGAGSGALQVQDWSYRFRDRRVAAAVNVILTPGNCIPVIVDERVLVRPRMTDVTDLDKPRPKPKAKAFYFGALYSNVKTQISDPSVFDPPSYCKATSNTLYFDPDVDFTSIIQRFVTVP